MQLIILDYVFGTVHIIKDVPDNIEDTEDFVYNKLGYKDSDISWILLEDDFLPLYYSYDKLLGKKVYDNKNFMNYD